jgi:hypothetical protein
MGQKGREIALREFDLRKMVGQISILYEELLSTRKK